MLVVINPFVKFLFSFRQAVLSNEHISLVEHLIEFVFNGRGAYFDLLNRQHLLLGHLCFCLATVFLVIVCRCHANGCLKQRVTVLERREHASTFVVRREDEDLCDLVWIGRIFAICTAHALDCRDFGACCGHETDRIASRNVDSLVQNANRSNDCNSCNA